MIPKTILFFLVLCGLSCQSARPTAQGKQRVRLLGGHGGAGGQGQANGANGANGAAGQDGKGGVTIKANKD